MDAADTAAQIIATRAILANLNAQILAFTDLTIQRYTFDTGQGSQTVYRQDLDHIIEQRAALQNNLSTLCLRQTGNGVLQARPLF